MSASQIQLRPYQIAALEAIEKAQNRGIQRPLVESPTGSGKTVLFAEWLRRRGGRALVLAHREELLRQAASKIQAVMPGTWVGTIQAGRDERLAPVTVASVQTLAQPRRLARIAANYRSVVVDEAHHAPADSYRRVLEHLGAFERGGPVCLGVTATAHRGDQVALGHVWEEIVYRKSMIELIAEGYLCDLRAKQIRLDIDWRQLRSSHGDYVQSQAGEMFEEANGPEHVAEAWVRWASERKGLVFTPTVEVAHSCAEALRARGVPAEAVDGTTPSEERQAILERLHTGETRAVVNCGVLTEGYDEPSIDVIVMARPTRSRTLYIQMLGRSTRRWPGKEDALILDLVGATSQHDLVTASTLFGLGLEALEREDDPTLTQVLREQQEQGHQLRFNGRLISVDVDLLERKAARWVATGGGAYALSVPDGMLLIEPVPDGVRILHEQRGQPAEHVGQAASLELALGMAEAHAAVIASQAGRWGLKLLDPNAQWRGAWATERQLETLRKFRVPIPTDLTKGQASDLISREIARANARKRARGARA